MKTLLQTILIPLCAGLVFTGTLQDKKDTSIIRVALHRVDGVKPGVLSGLSFDTNDVAEALKKHPLKLPDPLPAESELGYFNGGPIYALKQIMPGEPKIKLIMDANANFDLTDDVPLELAKVESIVEGTVIKIARPFGGASPRTEWLPYLVAFEQGKGYDGNLRDSVVIGSFYDFQGEFRLGKNDYAVEITDGDARGRFVREKLVNVFIGIRAKSEEKATGGGRFFELFPLEGALYKVNDFAEDGSWIEFAPSGLEPTSIGKAAPDFEMTDMSGRKFHISDYKGRVVVLDFWYVWCKPCIAKFPAIKKMLEKYKDEPLATIGINIDEASRVEQAKKVIADYELTWRQVVEGKGEFIPAYQIYGRLPERPMSFPIYVAIDELGVTRYATNDFEKMGRFLEAHFNDPLGPQNVLFIPLSQKYGQTQEIHPVNAVDFTSQKVKDLAASGKLKMPQDTPPGARVGLLSNGIALIAFPGLTPGRFRLIFDSNHDFDLNGEEIRQILLLDKADLAASAESKTMVEGLGLPYASGAIGFINWPFYARLAASGGDWPEIFFEGTVSNFAASFFAADTEYTLEIIDANGDRLFTEDDTRAAGFLKLKAKKASDWVQVHEGTEGIPIGAGYYRLRYVSDDGNLAELEREK